MSPVMLSRPFSGMRVIDLLSITRPMEASSVVISEASADTSIRSVAWPTSSFTSR